MDTGNYDAGANRVKASANDLSSLNPTVNVNANDNASGVISSVSANADALNGKQATVTITTVHKTSGGAVNGTAHVRGTALNGGDWGAKRSEYALTGELGREILVDPRTGKWRTIGDNGAEFVNVKRGDIIFNHKQTEALLSHGHINGRGSAFASGTAYAAAPSTGGGGGKSSVRITSDRDTFTGYHANTAATSANTAASNANTSAKKENTKATKSSSKAAKKLGDLYDWVAVRLTYFANKTKEIADQINDYISGTLKTSLLRRQMGAT